MIVFLKWQDQILLLDPLRPINKVFSLIAQEEQQCKIGGFSSVDSSNSMAFAVKNENLKSVRNSQDHKMAGSKNNKKERFCTHCNFHGHTIEKCYKQHGSPPGNKPRTKPNPQPFASVNQAVIDSSTKTTGPLGDFLHNLSTDQYQQFMNALSKQLTAFTVASEQSASTSSAGDVNYEDDWQG